MREYLEAGGPGLHTLGPTGLRSLVLRLWDERRSAEARHRAFVADRSSYDFASFWLLYRFADANDDATRAFMAETTAPDRYDLVALLPHGRLPLEADGVRSSNPWVQLHSQLLIEGVVRRSMSRVRVVQALTVSDRIRELRSELGC